MLRLKIWINDSIWVNPLYVFSFHFLLMVKSNNYDKLADVPIISLDVTIDLSIIVYYIFYYGKTDNDIYL